MSAPSGWYPDPGGGEGLFRFWDGNAWSAATSPHPGAPPPTPGVGSPGPPANQAAGQPVGSHPYGQGAYGQLGYGQSSYGGYSTGQPSSGPAGSTTGSAYANFQSTTKKKTPVGWWLGAAALLVVIVVVAVFAIRGLSSGGLGSSGGQPTTNACPLPALVTETPPVHPADGRVHGGPLSYPELPAPWKAPIGETRVPFGSDVASQIVPVQNNYDSKGDDWVASVLVAQLQAGDGFFTPQQGSQIVVKCILGAFYGNNEVSSDVTVNKASTIDGHDAWLVESQLSFDIPGLVTKGELLIVAIVSVGSGAGLYYASIPDSRPELVQPARDALRNLQVDG